MNIKKKMEKRLEDNMNMNGMNFWRIKTSTHAHTGKEKKRKEKKMTLQKSRDGNPRLERKEKMLMVKTKPQRLTQRERESSIFQ